MLGETIVKVVAITLSIVSSLQFVSGMFLQLRTGVIYFLKGNGVYMIFVASNDELVWTEKMEATNMFMILPLVIVNLGIVVAGIAACGCCTAYSRATMTSFLVSRPSYYVRFEYNLVPAYLFECNTNSCIQYFWICLGLLIGLALPLASQDLLPLAVIL